MKQLSFFAINEALQKAAKKKPVEEGQYEVVPDWMLAAGNTAETLTSSQRGQAKRILAGTGKLNPEDFKKIVAGGNLDLINILSDKQSLTPEQAIEILSANTPYSGASFRIPAGKTPAEVKQAGYTYSDHQADELSKFGGQTGFRDKRRQTKKMEMYDKLIKRLSTEEHRNKLIEQGSDDAVNHLMHSHISSTEGTGQPALFHLVTQRKNLSPSLFDDASRRLGLDEGTLTEALNHENQHIRARALNNFRGTPSPAIVSAIIRSGDDAQIGSMVGNSSIPLTNDMLKKFLLSPNDDIRRKAMRRAGRLTDDDPSTYSAHETAVNGMNNKNDLEAFMENYAADTRYSANQRKLPTSLANAILNRSVQFGHVDKELVESIPAYPELSNKLFNVAADEGYTMQSLMRNKEHRANISDDTIKNLLEGSAFAARDHLMRRLAEDESTSGDLLHSVYNKVSAYNDWDQKRVKDNVLSSIARHENTPETVTADLLSRGADALPENILSAMASGANVPKELWNKTLASSANPNVRAASAKSPHLDADNITAGLSDPHKDVRRSWIKHAPESLMTPAHWESIKTDKSALNRAAALHRDSVPSDIIRHFLTKEKSGGVLAQVLSHASATPELIDEAIKSQNPHNMIAATNGKIFSADHNKTILRRLNEDRVTKLAKLNKQAVDGKITPEDLTKGVDKIAAQHHESIVNLGSAVNLHPEDISSLISAQPKAAGAYGKNHLIYKLSQNDMMTTDHWEQALKEGVLPTEHIGSYASSIKLTPETWMNLAQKSVTPDQQHLIPTIMKNGTTPDSVLKFMIDNGGNTGNGRHIARVIDDLYDEYRGRKDISTDVTESALSKLDGILQGENQNHKSNARNAMNKIANHKDTSIDHLTKLHGLANEMSSSDDWNTKADGQSILERIASHHRTPISILGRLSRHENSSISRAANDSLSAHSPDTFNSAIGGHQVDIHPAVEKLKNLKGLVQEMGNGEGVPKAKMPNKAQGLPNELFDAKGIITPKSIDEYIDKLPKDKYNVSYDKWGGAQRHDRTVDQMVMQLNLTDNHIQALKDQGLYDTFREVHKMSFRSGHPVRKHSLGWARIDSSHDGHLHIDEIQSDLGQGTIRQIEQAKEKGQMSAEEANKYTDHLKKIIKVLSGQFKDINHAIAGAVHQNARLSLPEFKKELTEGKQSDIKSLSYDNVEDQATQSGLHTSKSVNTDLLTSFYNKDLSPDSYEHKAISSWAKQNGVENSKELGLAAHAEQLPQGTSGLVMPVPLSGFMQATYKQYPKDVGYEQKPKKEIMPNTQAPEETFQYRKLVKSLTKLKDLYILWKSME